MSNPSGSSSKSEDDDVTAEEKKSSTTSGGKKRSVGAMTKKRKMRCVNRNGVAFRKRPSDWSPSNKIEGVDGPAFLEVVDVIEERGDWISVFCESSRSVLWLPIRHDAHGELFEIFHGDVNKETSSKIKLTIKTYIKEEIIFDDIDPKMTVIDLKRKIHIKYGVPLDNDEIDDNDKNTDDESSGLRVTGRAPLNSQWLLFGGRYLYDARTLKTYGIVKDATLHFQLKFSLGRFPMPRIFTFTTTDQRFPDATKWLMLSDEKRAKAPKPPSAILINAWLMLSDEKRAKAPKPTSANLINVMERESASVTLTPKIKHTGETLLNANQRRQFIRFMDAARSSVAPGSMDLKIVLGKDIKGTGCREAFKVLLDLEADDLFEIFLKILGRDANYKIVLRRTEGPGVQGCIRLHCSTLGNTVHFALNNDREYDGGRLCFVTGMGKLTVPKRPAGTATVHPAKVLRGETRLHRGVRYSLLVVHSMTELSPNGKKDKDVHCISDEKILMIQAEHAKRKYARIAKMIESEISSSRTASKTVPTSPKASERKKRKREGPSGD